jgi:hypothetical protein
VSQAVSLRLLETEIGVRARVSPCEICRGQIGSEKFLPEIFCFLLSVSFHRISPYLLSSGE